MIDTLMNGPTQESNVALVLMLAEEAITDAYSSRARLESLRWYLPYCWHPEDGCTCGDSDGLILLSRDYKPIGSAPRSVSVPYENYPHLMAPRAVVHGIAEFAPNNAHRDPRVMARWFYNDSTAPWNGKRHAEALLKLIRANITALYGESKND